MTECHHNNKKIVAFQKANGRVYAFQCQECGDRVGNWIKKTEAIRVCGGEPPDEDKDLVERSNTLHLQALADDKAEWFRWYNGYLRSSEWASKRAAVFERADGVCEGCRKTAATQVHHLTYKHAGNEFLWELVAICDACHERVHEG